jgi:hypothetical protein
MVFFAAEKWRIGPSDGGGSSGSAYEAEDKSIALVLGIWGLMLFLAGSISLTKILFGSSLFYVEELSWL